MDCESRNRVRRFYAYAKTVTANNNEAQVDRINTFVASLNAYGAARVRQLLDEKFPIA